MKLNLFDISDEHLEYDFCVAGAGVAGIVVANELRRKFPDRSICLVESGDFTLKNRHNRELRNLHAAQLEIKDTSREFAIGGATNTWGGLTSSYGPLEFSGRDFLEVKGWPIDYETLAAHYAQVSEKYDFISAGEVNPPEDLFDGGFMKHPFCAYTTAVNYKSFLNPETIDIIYNAHVIDIVSSAGSVERLSLNGIGRDRPPVCVKAKTFVLAMGALETVKALLNAERCGSLTLGQESRFLGRYFMNHPKGNFGVVELFSPTIDLVNYVGAVRDGVLRYWGLYLPEKVQREEKLLNCHVKFTPIMPWRDDRLVFNFVQLVKKSKRFIKVFFLLQKGKQVRLLDYAETGDLDDEEKLRVESFFRSLANLFLYIYYRIFNLTPRTTAYKIRNYMEMEPRYENAITLSNRRDTLGNLELDVRYSLSKRDRDSLRRLHAHLGAHLEEKGIGRVVSNFNGAESWPVIADSSHHMGGTIMGTGADNSFVNSRMRVHGLDNLYVASSSVFPISGSANPTWTIAALAHMLVDRMPEADHSCANVS